jgi:hypothetical protein
MSNLSIYLSAWHPSPGVSTCHSRSRRFAGLLPQRDRGFLHDMSGGAAARERVLFSGSPRRRWWTDLMRVG